MSRLIATLGAVVALAAGVAFYAAPCHACGGGDESSKKETKKSESQGKPEVIDLKNAECPVMGGKARKDVTTDYEGLRVHFCCAGCDEAFLEDPKDYLAKMGIEDVERYKADRRREAEEAPKDKAGEGKESKDKAPTDKAPKDKAPKGKAG